jgi:polysaccharide deacetylase family protein (PEP-CTERM system associated)
MSSEAQQTTHFFTVDVEEYFQVKALEGAVVPGEWINYPSRVGDSVGRLVDLLASHHVRGTFFTLGWLARYRPQVVRIISEAGHEVASHGFSHQRVTCLDKDAFRRDVRESKMLLEDICGREVLGYRAPSFSIIPGYEWAFDVLIEEGYRYDSSLFPVRRKGYGYPSSPQYPHRIRRAVGEIAEIPLATTGFAGFRLPAAGGGYLRHFPFSVIRRAFDEAGIAGQPAAFYTHPWEIDPDQPRFGVSRLNQIRHYRGLSRTFARIDRLLGEFRFGTIESYLAALETKPPIAGAA